MSKEEASAQMWRFRLTKNLGFLLVLYYISYKIWKNELWNFRGTYKEHDFSVIKMTNGCSLQQLDDSKFVTFIIPSKGRDTFDRTIQSLLNQPEGGPHEPLKCNNLI
jgi:hypothetical protein